MAWQDLTWRNCNSPLSDERIHEVENTLGIQFPLDYRDCVRECHGGIPSKRNFSVAANNLEFGSCLAVLLSFSDDDSENILQTHENLSDQLPRSLIPFAEDGGGDYMCFDYRNLGAAGAPAVVFWHRTGLPDNEITQIAPNFTAFIELLSSFS